MSIIGCVGPMFGKVDIAVINLDRRPDRMACIYKNIPFLFQPMTPNISELRDKFMSAGDQRDRDRHHDRDHDRGYYRRFPAIDGMNLSQYYSEFPDLLDTIRDKPRVLGEVGCSLSHYSLWKSHAQRPNADYLLVFEDDVLFTDKSFERMKEVLSALQTQRERWDVMYVGGQWTPDYDIDSAVPSYFQFQHPRRESLERYFHTAARNDSERNAFTLHSNTPNSFTPNSFTPNSFTPNSFTPNSFGVYKRRNLSPAVIHGNRNVWFTPLFRTAGAYLVSKRGAKQLLDAVETDTALFMKTPLDMWLLEMDFRGYIEAYDRFPHPFYQAGFEMVREPSHAQNDIHRTDFQTVKLPESESRSK